MSAAPYYDHYPYEKQCFTDAQMSEMARRQDHRITELQHEIHLLKDELYTVNTWRNKVIPILEANGIDVDAITNVMGATQEVFGE